MRAAHFKRFLPRFQMRISRFGKVIEKCCFCSQMRHSSLHKVTLFLSSIFALVANGVRKNPENRVIPHRTGQGRAIGMRFHVGVHTGSFTVPRNSAEVHDGGVAVDRRQRGQSSCVLSMELHCITQGGTENVRLTEKREGEQTCRSIRCRRHCQNCTCLRARETPLHSPGRTKKRIVAGSASHSRARERRFRLSELRRCCRTLRRRSPCCFHPS